MDNYLFHAARPKPQGKAVSYSGTYGRGAKRDDVKYYAREQNGKGGFRYFYTKEEYDAAHGGGKRKSVGDKARDAVAYVKDNTSSETSTGSHKPVKKGVTKSHASEEQTSTSTTSTTAPTTNTSTSKEQVDAVSSAQPKMSFTDSLAKGWREFSMTVTGTLNSGKSMVEGFIKDAGKTLSSVGKDVVNNGKQLLRSIDRAVGIGDKMRLGRTDINREDEVAAANRYNNSLLGKAQKFGQNVSNWASNTAQNIGNAATNAWNTVSNIPNQIADWAGVDERQRYMNALSNPAAQTYAPGFTDQAKNAYDNTLLGRMQNGWNNAVGAVNQFGQNAINAGRNLVSDADRALGISAAMDMNRYGNSRDSSANAQRQYDAARSAYQGSLLDRASDWANNTAQNVGNWANNTWNNVSQAANNAIYGDQKIASEYMAEAKSYYDRADTMDALGDHATAESLRRQAMQSERLARESSGLVGTAQNVGNWANNTWNNVSQAANNTAQNVGNWANNTWNNVSQAANNTAQNVGNFVTDSVTNAGRNAQTLATNIGAAVGNQQAQADAASPSYWMKLGYTPETAERYAQQYMDEHYFNVD